MPQKRASEVTVHFDDVSKKVWPVDHLIIVNVDHMIVDILYRGLQKSGKFTCSGHTFRNVPRDRPDPSHPIPLTSAWIVLHPSEMALFTFSYNTFLVLLPIAYYCTCWSAPGILLLLYTRPKSCFGGLS